MKEWLGTVARLVTGGVWIVAGGLKLADPYESVRAVRAYDLLPEVVVPTVATRERVDAIIFDELTVGEVRPDSQAELRAAVAALAADGAQAVALACTELELALTTAELPLIATARTHALAAADAALAG